MPVFAVLALAQDILIIIYCSVKALVTQMDRKTYTKKMEEVYWKYREVERKPPHFFSQNRTLQGQAVELSWPSTYSSVPFTATTQQQCLLVH